jgi:hypothetical protein
MTARYERRCRMLLRSYPARYRQARGEELLSTLLDAAESGRVVPSLRDSWDVLRGGMATRWRAHPPMYHWLLYRFFGTRLPYEYRWWARDDILGRWNFVRHMFVHAIWTFLIAGWVVLLSENDLLRLSGDRLWIGILGILSMFALGFWREVRQPEYMLNKHEFHSDGTPYEERPFMPADGN